MPRGHATTEEGQRRKLANLIPHQQKAGLPSRNPRGVLANEGYVETVQILRQNSPAMVQRLVDRILHDPDVTLGHLSGAVHASLDRAWGKAKEDPEAASHQMSEDTARRIADALEARNRYVSEQQAQGNFAVVIDSQAGNG